MQGILPPGIRDFEKPLYEHDCAGCHYLGRSQSDREWSDLYIHVRPKGRTELLVRHSNEDSDYQSCGVKYVVNTPGRLADTNFALALARALNCGFIQIVIPEELPKSWDVQLHGDNFD